MKVTLIRHTSVDVPQGTCYGQTDVPLRDTFEEEAAQTLLQLTGKTFDHVYTSPLSRCIRLANYCGHPEAQRDARLMEINFGAWEMRKFDEIDDPRLQEWFDDYLHVSATEGESFMQQYQRVSQFLDELKQQSHRHVALFVHGGVILCAQIYAGVLRPDEAFGSLTPYGGVVEIEI